ncbi:LysR family transcriptional regulator [Mesorhizobium waimense]|uniref:LysR family transcriptional regulator n=1 Tax=Mesorhizobium waimense TaxID=1300307 RepID=A0A3A5KVT7_9HYPH|nr:LysR substrate-binding domain-containing protein [Mesorhizobium waimense]RJT40672.1 LysR family transcriptional regulator [Mesorhizobium waimense]
MDSLRHLLPSANGLIAFEAAGRLLNFTAAGKELGMSQAAVSLAIRKLEEQFRTKLFVRGHRRVHLTEAGARFFADVSLGLSHIQKSAERLKGSTGGNHVTLSASTAFVSLWMVPRLQRFREDLPGIELRIQTSDRDIDLAAEGIPLGIVGGDNQDWPDYFLLPIAPEEIYPVCSPSYLVNYGKPQTVADLARHRLIHLDEPHRPAVTWPDWLASAGLDGSLAPQGLRINDYVSVIQSVMEGQGVALGWAHLTERLVKTGSLVRLTEHVLITGKSFNVAWPKKLDVTEHVAAVRKWLADQNV